MVVAPTPRSSPPRHWRTFAILCVAALVGVAVPVFANHVQNVSSGGATYTVEFDHDGDNAWWVEFQARSSNGDSMFLGEVLVEGTSTWRGMNFAANDYQRQQAGWSKFAPEQAFNVPDGKRVMFRVHMQDGATGNTGIIQSCWFTHPAGVEQCGTTTTTTTPTTSTTTTTTGSTFNPQFTGFRGNEWWVQANVGTTSHCISKVDVRSDNGAWMPIKKQSWGPTAWAASYHFPQGSILQMRATSCSGQVDLSSCRQWIPPANTDATIVACPGTSQPWRTTHVGDAGLYASIGDMAISDVDNDGRRDVTLATSRGLRVYEWTGTTWTTELITSLDLGGVAAGDGDGDGDNEVYAMLDGRVDGQTGTTLMRFEKTATGWDDEPMFGFPETNVGDMTLGNLDGVAGPELYLGLYEGWCDPQTPGLCISNSTVYHVRKAGVSWEAAIIAEPSGHLDSVWIGDGDNDGAFELYVGHGTRHADRTTQILRSQGQWVSAELPGQGSESGMALVVAGDGDRNGRSEVYTANWHGAIWKNSYDPVNGWTQTFLTDDSGYNPISLFLGDADSDGTQELYMTTAGGDLVQVRWSGSAWMFTKIADPQLADHEGQQAFLVVGDGDGDSQREAFIAVAFLPVQGESSTWDTGATKVYKVAIPRSTGFDATFSGVKGNEWWVQASVSGNQPIQDVDARINCSEEWRSLTKQSYGWAASFHVPAGSKVDFRAISTSGNMDFSGGYVWPNATPTSPC
jgi:hypothetical protein